jgi:prevent-host-death family protein
MAGITESIAAKEAKEQISRLLDEIEAGGVVEITARGKAVALLVPLASKAPEMLRRVERVTSRDIKQGKRNFTGVIVHGPYVVTRSGEEVAFLEAAPEAVDAASRTSPQQHIVELLEKQVMALEDLQLVKREYQAAINLHRHVNVRLKARIELLKEMNDPLALKYEQKYNEIDKGDAY